MLNTDSLLEGSFYKKKGGQPTPKLSATYVYTALFFVTPTPEGEQSW